MTFRPTLIEAPAELPVTAAECKAHAVVEHEEQDGVIDAVIAGVVADLDGFRGILGRAMVTQTWRLEMAAWDRCFVLPVPDVSAVAITYDDEDGAEQAGPDVTLHPIARGTMVRISQDWTAPSLHSDSAAPVRMDFTCGYGGASDVPAALKVAIMQRVAQAFEDRTGETAAGAFSERLIAPHRWLSI